MLCQFCLSILCLTIFLLQISLTFPLCDENWIHGVESWKVVLWIYRLYYCCHGWVLWFHASKGFMEGCGVLVLITILSNVSSRYLKYEYPFFYFLSNILNLYYHNVYVYPCFISHVIVPCWILFYKKTIFIFMFIQIFIHSNLASTSYWWWKNSFLLPNTFRWCWL